MPIQWLHRLPVLAGLLFLSCAQVGAAGEPGRLDLSEHEGKVVVVDFWASWCVPCRRSFPWMNAMQKKYGDEGLVIIGVNMDSDPGDAARFLDDFPAEFRIVYDPDGDLARQYEVIAMPSSYLFDRDGNRVARHLGFKVRQQDEYEALILETLKR